MIPVKRTITHTVIDENDKALLVEGKDGGYETWIKIRSSRTGQLYEPTDEDVGVWAWSHYSLDRARKVFNDITEGRRTVRPMIEDVEAAKEIVSDRRN